MTRRTPRPTPHPIADLPTGLTDVDAIAETAHTLTVAIRELDPRDLLADIATQCTQHPGRMAQVMMALAAWVDPYEPMSVRDRRVNAIIAGHYTNPTGATP